MSDQVLPRFGVDQRFHQRIHGGVFQAHEIAAARVVGTGALPILTLLVARGVGLREAADDHVEVT